MATTNHIEKLDKALIRPGRFDYIYEFNFLKKKDICTFINYNYHDKHQKATKYLRDDVELPMSVITTTCFESENINECIDRLNQTSITQDQS